MNKSLFESLNFRCQTGDHNGKAIFLCLLDDCANNLVCSECMIDYPDHFTTHNKHFLPLDNEKKFNAAINLTKLQGSNATGNLSVDSQVDFYLTAFRQKVLDILDESIESNRQALKDRLVAEKPEEHLPFTGMDCDVDDLMKRVKEENDPEALKQLKIALDNIIVLEHPSVVLNETKIEDLLEESFCRSFGLKTVNAPVFGDNANLNETFSNLMNVTFQPDEPEDIQERNHKLTKRLSSLKEKIEKLSFQGNK